MDAFARVFRATITMRRRDAGLDDLMDRGYDVLAGRVDLKRLRPADAEPYLQGLDVLERRGCQLLPVLAVRGRYGRRNPWRLSPDERVKRKLPDTPVGRRQRAWLDQLAQAGLLPRSPEGKPTDGP